MGKWRYGVILDAGSSGTRVYVYKWLDNAHARAQAGSDDLNSLPELMTDKKWTKKIHPGVSTFGNKPASVGPDHLEPLLKHALKHVPKKEVENTPFFLLATAGVRLLPETQRTQLLDEICEYTRVNSDFLLPDCGVHIQAIPGETEGLYGWIAANYLLGGFDRPQDHDHGKNHHTYGFLDMGGASAQIAFAPNATETEKHANDLKLLRLRNINGDDTEYRVFVTTWLGFGANQARMRYVETLRESTDSGVMELPDPCLPSGLKITTSGKKIQQNSAEEAGTKQHLIGTGNFPECLRQTFPLLEKNKPCNDDPCLLGGVHVPAIDFDVNHFVGVSEYWHTTHEIFEMSHDDKAYDFHTYQSRVKSFCSQPWSEILNGVDDRKWGKKVDETTALEVCFKASWLINMLHDGIGIPRIGLEEVKNGKNITDSLVQEAKKKGFLDPFRAVDKIEGVEVSWTLGKMVLYASSEIPASPQGLPVGFGTNAPGIALPADFQLPSASSDESGSDVHASLDEDWHDALFRDSPRRIPGVLLFMLIICVAVYFLCGRERRNVWAAKFCSAFGFGRCSKRRRAHHGSGTSRLTKFFGLSTPTYERVAVDGGESGRELELPLYESDDSANGDAEGRASGWATPKLVVDASAAELGSPNKRSMLSEGMLARVESKERVTPGSLGLGMGLGRSRTASPAPRRSILKESVD